MRCLFSMGYVKFPRLKWQRLLGYNLITGRPPPLIPAHEPLKGEKRKQEKEKKHSGRKP